MKYRFIDMVRGEFPVRRVAAVIGTSRSGYYAWKGRKPSKRAVENKALLDQVKAIHKKSRKSYGSPRIFRELKKIRPISRKRVERLAVEAGISVKPKKRFITTTDSNHGQPVKKDLVTRNFTTDHPDKVWVSDITYVPTRQGWAFTAIFVDLFSRRTVGWATGPSISAWLVIDAFLMAVRDRKPPRGLIVHSDQGGQYVDKDFIEAVRKAGARRSMSRKGNCWDNAVAESWFATLKKECVTKIFDTKEEARREIFDYVAGFYNTTRMHSTLGYQSPAEYERKYYENKSALSKKNVH
jgi:transposase InsO family protein